MQEAWDRATRLSEEAGVEYKDRAGNIRHPKRDDDSLVGQVLRRYVEQMGGTYS